MWVAVLGADGQKGVGLVQKKCDFLAFPPKMYYLCGDKKLVHGSWFMVYRLLFTVYCLRITVYCLSLNP